MPQVNETASESMRQGTTSCATLTSPSSKWAELHLMHHSAVCVNAVYLGFLVTGVVVVRSRNSPDTPPDLRVNVAGCFWCHDATPAIDGGWRTGKQRVLPYSQA
jgi:hypothetical protein